jgi:hypothetical protein
MPALHAALDREAARLASPQAYSPGTAEGHEKNWAASGVEMGVLTAVLVIGGGAGVRP